MTSVNVNPKTVDSISDLHRKEGNTLYASATENLSAVVRQDRLTKSVSAYYKAWNTALNDKEKASAAKNYGLASWRLGKIHRGNGSTAEYVNYFFMEALSYMAKAEIHGKEASLDQRWLSQIELHLNTFLDSAVSNILCASVGVVVGKKVNMIIGILKTLPERKHHFRLHMEMAGLYFKDGLCLLSAGDYKGALNRMYECYQPIEEAKLCTGTCSDSFRNAEIYLLQEDVYVHKCVAESMQMRKKGDAILNQVLLEEENLNVTLVYDAIDCFTQSIILTRDRDIEGEAITHSRLGLLYHNVLKLRERAKRYLLVSVELGHSLFPRNFNTDDWFVKAKKVLEEYQKETTEKELSEYNKTRQPYLDTLKDELDKLVKEFEKDAIVFLEFLYKTHPPKNKNLVMAPKPDEMTPEFKKKALQTAILHYHPDKQNVDDHGMLWKIFCEEITKWLTNKYEYFKG